MSLMTTWTTDLVPPRREVLEPREPLAGPRTAWDCANCDLLNPGGRRRCRECGTSRHQR